MMAATITPRPHEDLELPAPKGWLPENRSQDFPTRFAELKAQIISGEKQIQNVVNAWNEVIAELATKTEIFNATQQEVIFAATTYFPCLLSTFDLSGSHHCRIFQRLTSPRYRRSALSSAM